MTRGVFPLSLPSVRRSPIRHDKDRKCQDGEGCQDWISDGDGENKFQGHQTLIVIGRRRSESTHVRYLHHYAGVAELADAQDLKSCDAKASCGFDPRPRQSVTTIARF